MVQVLIGDMFESRAQTLVNTVNTVGIMGKGIALEFKKQFPAMFRDYEARCKRRQVKLGEPYLFKSVVPPWILNFPTKAHWRSVTSLDDIIRGLEYLLQHYESWGITSIAVPPLGCGQGQLDWRVVGPTLYRYLDRMAISVELYAPFGTAHEELQPTFLQGSQIKDESETQPRWIKPGWVALVEILKRIEDQPYHHPVGRTIFQKIAYVATEEGIPTELHYAKGSYGPFSSTVKKAVTGLVNNGLIREKRLGQMFSVTVGPTYEDAAKSYSEQIAAWQPAIDKVVDLFMRTDTNEAEIVASVLFITRELSQALRGKPTEQAVLDACLDWKRRRRPPLSPRDVGSTIRNLAAIGWIDVHPSADLPLPADMLL